MAQRPGENAALCDALSTALYIMGPAEACAFMDREEMRGYRCLMILYSYAPDHCEVVTNLPEGEFTLTDREHFVLISAADEEGRIVCRGQILNTE